MRGDHQDVHGTMIAMQEADVSLRLMTSVRNRAIEAYREIMRMGS
jgi:flagellar hook-basal body complex protein FliE